MIAHPLTGSPPLAVPPLVLAAVTVVLAALVATRVAASPSPPAALPVLPRPAPAPAWLRVTRVLGTLAFLLLLASARGGPADEPGNLAAVATTHLLWPLLLVLAALLGPLLWRAVDPFWAPGPPPEPPPPVWPAIALGAGWAAFAGIYAVSVEPRALAAVLAGYALALLAGSLALGRDRWLPRADAVGLVVSWTGLVRRWRLVGWHPPPGAAALLGAAFGGVAFTRFRLSSGWLRVAVLDHPLAWHRGLAVAAPLAGAALAYAAERWAARRGGPDGGAPGTGAAGSVAAALVPVVAATVVAAGLRRALVAAQLLPQVATDPFGRGWRLLGDLGEPRLVDVNPWGTAVQQSLSAGLVALGALAGAWVLARRVRGVRARDPAALAVYVAAFLGTLVVVVR